MPVAPPTPKEIRDNLNLCRKSDKNNREAYRENIRFLNGDQWDPLEVQKRRNKRLCITADMLNAPVDQIVNSVRQNKPGPAVSPVSNTDQDGADVMAGLLRQVDYTNNAWVAIETAMENATGGNFGCWGVDLKYRNDRSFLREIVVREIPNANETVYFDPSAIKKDRSDADFAFEVMVLSPEKYKRAFPDSKAVKESGFSSDKSFLKNAISLFQSFAEPSIQDWVTEDGIQVVRYWRKETEFEKLRMYSNGVAYWDSESEIIPEKDDKGNPVIEDKNTNPRDVEHTQLRCYISNGAEILKSYDWPINTIPLFPVYGRERWSDGKRWLFSMIQLAKQAQQAFNFAFTGACEVLSQVSKAPYLGLLGQFKSKLAQWQKANSELQSYLEFDEVTLSNGETYTTPPQRNLQEPPIQAFLAFCTMCANAIQRATSVYDPSLGKQKADQSGKAIQELDSQSSEGNFHWSDNLTITLTSYYKSNMELIQAEYDAAEVTTIIRPDGKSSEAVWINKEFAAGANAQGEPIMKRHNISDGKFALVVSVGKKFDDQREADIDKIDSLIEHLPPELLVQCADIIVMLQDLGPMGKELADRLTPAAYRNQNDPRSAAVGLAQATQQNAQLKALVQKMQFEIAAKMPQLELDKYKAELAAITQMRVAQEKNKNDEAERDIQTLEHFTNLAHEAASDALDRQNTLDLADKQIQAAQAAQPPDSGTPAQPDQGAA